MIKRYESYEIQKLVQILKKDGVISVPTDTVFGICARIDSERAYNKLVKVKNRPAHKAFPVMCANVSQIKDIAEVNENAEKIIREFMPGPITIILKKKVEVPSYITNGKDTIAIRLATSSKLKEIILKLDSPIFMTSANKSGEKECSTLEEIEENCPLLDGIVIGNVIFSKGSTIVDCTNNEIKVVREGPVLLEEIKKRIES